MAAQKQQGRQTTRPADHATPEKGSQTLPTKKLMPCYKPRQVWKPKTGRLLFRGAPGTTATTIPCGYCVGCRTTRTREWTVRVMHEAQMHLENCFITLTYEDQHLPENGQLEYEDWQIFIRALRDKTGKKIRFYMAGEYGTQLGRPHFHAALFGYSPHDQVPCKTGLKHTLYKSEELTNIWKKGFVSVGELTPQSAAYTAGYIAKKMVGEKAKAHYTKFNPVTGEWYELVPEFNEMSTAPGLGKSWYQKYRADVYPHDFVMLGDRQYPVPSYYDKLLEEENPALYEEIKQKRVKRAYDAPEEARPKKRNDDKHAVAIARHNLKKRTL